MRNISWCRVIFHPEENYAAHFAVYCLLIEIFN